MKSGLPKQLEVTGAISRLTSIGANGGQMLFPHEIEEVIVELDSLLMQWKVLRDHSLQNKY